jgi:hypothetical protein
MFRGDSRLASCAADWERRLSSRLAVGAARCRDGGVVEVGMTPSLTQGAPCH